MTDRWTVDQALDDLAARNPDGVNHDRPTTVPPRSAASQRRVDLWRSLIDKDVPDASRDWPVVLELKQRRVKAIARMQAGLDYMSTKWDGLTEAQRYKAEDAFRTSWSDLNTVLWLLYKVPTTDAGVCRRCRKVLLPHNMGPTYQCCGRFWSPGPRNAHLPIDFWTRYTVGDTYKGDLSDDEPDPEDDPTAEVDGEGLPLPQAPKPKKEPTKKMRTPNRTAACRSCGAAIAWLVTASGAKMPVDAETVTPGDTQYDARSGHISHFKTCPNADKH